MGLLAMLVLGVVALVAAVVVLGVLVKASIFAAKVILFGMLLLWLAKKLLGSSRPRSRGVELVGRPVMDVAPPGPQRDKYDIAAERELDQELGL